LTSIFLFLLLKHSAVRAANFSLRLRESKLKFAVLRKIFAIDAVFNEQHNTTLRRARSLTRDAAQGRGDFFARPKVKEKQQVD